MGKNNDTPEGKPAYTRATWYRLIDRQGNHVGYEGQFATAQDARLTRHFFEKNKITKDKHGKATRRDVEVLQDGTRTLRLYANRDNVGKFEGHAENQGINLANAPPQALERGMRLVPIDRSTRAINLLPSSDSWAEQEEVGDRHGQHPATPGRR